MSIFRRRPALRWLVPALVALLLAVAGSVVGVVTAVARDGLPHRSASKLLVDVQRARLDGLSGTIVQDAELGLPSLPALGGGGSSDLGSLVSGSHTLRLWYDGPDRVRLALLGTLGESDVVRRGTDLWTWSSSTKSATHRSLPSAARSGDAPHSLAEASPFTPQEAAEAALRAISPSTSVSTKGTAVVAGRDAYELVLRPRQHASLVGSVRIAIDGRTHVPTRVQVYARGADAPAFQVGFTSFDPSRPDASVFRFNPPRGTKVTEARGGPDGALVHGRAGHAPGAPGSTRGSRPDVAPRVVGRGWTSVVVASRPTGSAASSGGSRASGSLASMLRVLPRVHGSWGSGHLLSGALFSAVLTDDGRVAVGAVAPATLYAALGR